jgi:hypothetical protein
VTGALVARIHIIPGFDQIYLASSF